MKIFVSHENVHQRLTSMEENLEIKYMGRLNFWVPVTLKLLFSLKHSLLSSKDSMGKDIT